jgi:hypothetical protein
MNALDHSLAVEIDAAVSKKIGYSNCEAIHGAIGSLCVSASGQ